MGNSDKISSGDPLTDQPANYHVPVLLKECIDGLQINPAYMLIDCGGRADTILAVLKELSGNRLIFDQDKDAAANLPKDDR